MVCKNFLIFHGLSFHFWQYASLWSMKVSNIDEVQFTKFSCCSCFWCHIWECFVEFKVMTIYIFVLELIFACDHVRVQFHSSGCSYPDVPVPFHEEIILSWLKCFGCLFENQLGTEVCFSLTSILFSDLHVYPCTSTTLSDSHCFVINFEFGMCVPYLVLFTDCFWIFYVPCNSIWIL